MNIKKKRASPPSDSGEDAAVSPTSPGADPMAATTPAAGDPSLDEEAHLSNGVSKANWKDKFGTRPDCFTSTFQEMAFIFQATNATAASSFFQGATAIITVSIGKDLGMTQGEISWITASTALTAGAFQLGLGQLADLVGRRATFIVGMVSFSALSLLASFAKTPYWMDVVCGFIGVSTAMVVPPAIGIMGAAYGEPSRRKNIAFSAFGAGNPLGFVFGSILSGVATRIFNWRAAFVLIAIIWAILAVLAWWTIPNVEAYPLSQPLKGRLSVFVKTFDWVGTVLTIFGTGLLTAGITLGPVDGWKAGHIIAMLVLGVALLVVFVFWERVYSHPLMPPQIWKDRNFTFIILACLPGYMAFLSSNFWVAFFMQDLQRLAPLDVAVRLIPQAVAGLFCNFVAGAILHRVNNTILITIGSASYVGSNVLLALMKPESSYWAFIFPSLILSVFGADFYFNVVNMYVMQSLPRHQQALAGGIFNTLLRLSMAVALGISTAVFTTAKETMGALDDPMVPYAKAFQVAIGLSAASFLFLPFVRLRTQGNSSVAVKDDGAVPVTTPGQVEKSAPKET